MRKVESKTPVEKREYETPDDLSIPDFSAPTDPVIGRICWQQEPESISGGVGTTPDC